MSLQKPKLIQQCDLMNSLEPGRFKARRELGDHVINPLWRPCHQTPGGRPFPRLQGWVVAPSGLTGSSFGNIPGKNIPYYLQAASSFELPLNFCFRNSVLNHSPTQHCRIFEGGDHGTAIAQ